MTPLKNKWLKYKYGNSLADKDEREINKSDWVFHFPNSKCKYKKWDKQLLGHQLKLKPK